MRYFSYTVIIIFIALLQSSFVSYFTVWRVMPNVLLLVVFLMLIYYDFAKIWWLIVVGGLIADCLSGWPFGSIMLSLALTAQIVNKFKNDVFSNLNYFVLLLLILLATISYNLILMLAIKVLDFNLIIRPFYNMWRLAALEVIYNAALFTVAYHVIKKIQNKKQFSAQY